MCPLKVDLAGRAHTLVARDEGPTLEGHTDDKGAKHAVHYSEHADTGIDKG